MKSYEKWFVLIISAIIVMSCIKESDGRPINANANAEYVGCAGASYDDWETSPYVLPFPVGKTYSINLAHCSGSYHAGGEPDQFAIDFDMGHGAEVTAARDGVVVFVEESGFDGEFPNNKVVLQHEDRSHTQYMHLTYQGALVSKGQVVKKGDVLGLTGATGLAGYPHLHFVATGGRWKYPYSSFPVTFSNTSENTFSLEPGKVYTALAY
ncbi:M23 family metallopeptidase [Maribacter sp. 2308TA10-17]|uniref:M23 family metallopeptidase n=1 Tax=Maribacter sp. 2308TA10-17 TaxID=3386276 RepID=UPI0039BD6D0F